MAFASVSWTSSKGPWPRLPRRLSAACAPAIVIVKREAELQLAGCGCGARRLFHELSREGLPESVTSNAMIMAAPAGSWPR